MLDNDSSNITAATLSPSTLSWIERARRMVEYHPDALEFIQRASEHFPAKPAHIQLVLRLWIEADTLDSLILPLLNELNAELVDGQGELDTTRGVSTRHSAFETFDNADAYEVVYECAWSLHYEPNRSVSVILSVDEYGVFHAQGRGGASTHESRVGYPITINALQDAIVEIYVAETTSS